MNRFHFAIYTGPVGVQEIAQRLTATALHWQRMEMEGTERVYVSIEARERATAESQLDGWATRAHAGRMLSGRIGKVHVVQLLRVEDAQHASPVITREEV